MTEQTFSIPCCNCNRPIVPGDESINTTIMRQRIGEGYIQPTVADSLLEICEGCAPMALNEKVKALTIPAELFNAVVFKEPYVVCGDID